MKRKICSFLITITLFCFTATGQASDNAKAIFPNADVVYTHYNKTLTIKKDKTGEPYAFTDYDIGMVMLTDVVSNMQKSYTIYHSSSFDELTSLQAFTNVPSGNGYKKVKVTEINTGNSSSNDIFYDDVKETKLYFPSLTQNAVTQVSYTLKHSDAHLLTPFFVPLSMPAVKTTYTVIVPDGVDIRYIVKNDPDNIFKFKHRKKGKQTIYTWEAEAYKTVDFYGNAPGFRYFTPHIIVHITGYESENGYVKYLSELNDLYKWNFAFTQNININPDPALGALVDSLTGHIPDKMEKAKIIYKWVQNHIRYIAFEDGLQGFIPRQAKDIYVKRYGDCKDMASILTEMLRHAGINAYFTWIGTRDIPYSYNEVPLPIVDNHMIATMELDNKWYFLDATNSYSDLTLPPYSIQGKEALIGIDNHNYKILHVPVADADLNTITDSTFIELTDNGIKGFQKVDYTGYFGHDVLTAIKYRNENDKEKYVKSRMGKGSNKFLLGKFNVVNSEENTRYAQISADFEIPDYSKKIGDEYYINLNLEKITDYTAIMQDKRKVPLENDFKYFIRQHHILKIPENYTVTALPEDFNVDNEYLSIKIIYRIEGNNIIATQEFHNKTLMVYPKDFEKWNTALKLSIPKNKESIVLQPKK